ncbi:MAG: NADPH-dependent FMN reductase [Planctomycetota bacterium]
MSNKPKILAFAGSTRKESYNKKLVRLAAELTRSAGAEVTLIDLRDFTLPVFDEDLEAASGLPEAAVRLKRLMMEHHGFLIACPEYNSSITAVLKNAIDWASRRAKDEAPLECFRGKLAALIAASPGALGGLRGLVTVRSILGNIGMLVLPDQVAIPVANEAFNANGSLVDDKRLQTLKALCEQIVKLARNLTA